MSHPSQKALPAAVQDIQAALAALADEPYRLFQARLMPTVDAARILGVRMPALRQYAAQLYKNDPRAAAVFLNTLPHTYYEENNLHMMLLGRQKTDWPTLLLQLERFLPYIDNWATTDCGVPRAAFARHSVAAVSAALRWCQSTLPYTVRFGIVTLLGFTKTGFESAHLDAVAATLQGPCGEHYYVRMAVAWYISMALAHQWDAAWPWLCQNSLEPWVRAKAIQKTCESYQVPQAHKALLHSLR